MLQQRHADQLLFSQTEHADQSHNAKTHVSAEHMSQRAPQTHC